jgi:hypothetical protein
MLGFLTENIQLSNSGQNPTTNPDMNISHQADTILRQLASIKEEKESLDQREGMLKGELLNLIRTTVDKTYKGTFAKVLLITKRTYLYGNKIDELEARLKALKAVALKNKEAKIKTETEYLRIDWTE